MPHAASGVPSALPASAPYVVAGLVPLRIGQLVIDPPVLQAPMAGFTNFAFRQMIRDYGGVGLPATEMVNARGFVWIDREQSELPDRLWGVREEPRPLAVQIWDNDPDMLAQVGARLAHDLAVSVIDINFGCPVKQVSERACSGSYLLDHPDKMHAIISRVVAACRPVPVTAKIRLGRTRNTISACEVAQVVESAGAAALTVHGRTAQEFFKGRADWERISEIKAHLRSIPLIGNGDLDSPQAVLDALQHYDVDGVMIARAALGKPWLFAQVAAALRGQPVPADPTMTQQRQCLLQHYDRVVARFGESKGTLLMRKYACTYAQGRHGARAFRREVATVHSGRQFRDVVERFFPREA